MVWFSTLFSISKKVFYILRLHLFPCEYISPSNWFNSVSPRIQLNVEWMETSLSRCSLCGNWPAAAGTSPRLQTGPLCLPDRPVGFPGNRRAAVAFGVLLVTSFLFLCGPPLLLSKAVQENAENLVVFPQLFTLWLILFNIMVESGATIKIPL